MKTKKCKENSINFEKKTRIIFVTKNKAKATVVNINSFFNAIFNRIINNIDISNKKVY